MGSQLNFVRHFALLNCFGIGIANDEVNPLNVLFKHEVYGVASTTTDTQYFDDG